MTEGEAHDQALRTLTEAWLGLHQVAPESPPSIVRTEVLLPGRPGLLDIVADVDGRLAHLVVGLRGVADEQHFLRSGEEAALGLLDDDDGLAVCTDALRDAQLGPLLLATVRGVTPPPGTGRRPARRRRCHRARLRRPRRPDGVPVAFR